MLVNTSTQASDTMGSWKVGDMGWGELQLKHKQAYDCQPQCFGMCRGGRLCCVGFHNCWCPEQRKKAVVVLSASWLPVAAPCLYVCVFEFVYEDVSMTLGCE